MHQLGDRRLPATATGVPQTVGMLAATSGRGGYDLVIYNHSLPNGSGPATQQTITVRVRGAQATHTASLTRIDPDHGNTRQAWYDLGKPVYPANAQIEKIAVASEVSPTPIAPVRSPGNAQDLTFEIVLPAEGVAALHLR